jgi:hypothetical protein
MKTLARQQDKEELLRRLRTLRADSQRRWGKMSVHQMVRHVGDACRIGCGDVVVSDASGLAQRTVI